MGKDKEGVLGGVTSGAFRVAPWHGLGDSVTSTGEVVGRKALISDSIRTGGELLATAGLNWSVESATLDRLGLDLAGSNDHMAVFRGDTRQLLGIHSPKYGVVQNDVLGQYVDEILSVRSDARPVSAVELWRGRVVFLVIEFQDEVRVVRKDGSSDDKMTRYMGLYTSHDGSYPLAVKYMSQLWVCQNTFTPWNAETGFVIRHTRNASDIATAARDSLGLMVTSFEQFDAEVDRLLAIDANRRDLTDRVIPRVLGVRPTDEGRAQTIFDNKFDAIVAEWETNTRAETAFDAVMSVQGFEQHGSAIRGTTRDVASLVRVMRDDFPMTRKAVSVFA
jgi:hypothetical protein